MMGGHHAASGAAVWVAVTSTTPIAFGWYPVSEIGVMTGALVCAGAALLPDADHHNGTIAHSLPPVSEGVTKLVSSLSGGHRNGTHSLLGIAVFTAIAWVMGMVSIRTEAFGDVLVGPGIMAVLLIAFALRALKLTGGRRWWTWTISVTLGAAVAVFAPEEWYWMPFCVGLGCAAHIVGDMLTTRGVPLLWPLKFRSPTWVRRYRWMPFDDVWRDGGNLSVPILGDAGSWREWVFMTPVSAYAILGVGWAMLDQMGYDTLSVWNSAVATIGAWAAG
ncbi:metal-dependent hydrolase [Isoptericola sp. NEAU-Y5]|uniref:Metal-dependent hydrolase n=1 Tax=Isoptericola luteus TaxID=2879484 RepID=A0ABS7ZI84_9MICO|nr:metal-dependent hydrolase [Isoptericola sp. NEAU-Y5]MCA5893510.1 metal-dependent hydrolase [Isoptericola sp. NEAU-Y5]